MDGPAANCFTDGDFVGAKMDRNGLRPLRYSITKDGLIIMASEAGIVDVDEDNIISNYHMKSEEMILGFSLERWRDFRKQIEKASKTAMVN